MTDDPQSPYEGLPVPDSLRARPFESLPQTVQQRIRRLAEEATPPESEGG